jgi:hypothetical protein
MYIIQLTPQRGFPVTDYIKYYMASFVWIPCCSTKREIPLENSHRKEIQAFKKNGN